MDDRRALSLHTYLTEPLTLNLGGFKAQSQSVLFIRDRRPNLGSKVRRHLCGVSSGFDSVLECTPFLNHKRCGASFWTLCQLVKCPKLGSQVTVIIRGTLGGKGHPNEGHAPHPFLFLTHVPSVIAQCGLLVDCHGLML